MTMIRLGSISAVALVLVGAVLAMCLIPAAEDASAHHNCAALVGEQISLSKTSTASPTAVPIDASGLTLQALGQSRSAPA